MKRIIMLFSVASCLTVIGFTSCKSDKKEETATATTEATTTTEPTATMASDQNAATQDASKLTTANPGQTASNVNPQQSVAATAEGAKAASPSGPTTTVKFNESAYDYGKVVDGTVVKHTYKFTNTGKEPLIISDAKGSCGCTVPTWPKDPIAPGASAEINVQFDSKNKVGPQSKTVTVTANTNPPNTILTIRGEVSAKPK